jgi:tRNA threonylcarbamoyladenosine biosynthesis protein TsaE
VAAILAELVETGDLVVLTGDLGAGKTCFTQGLGAGLGVNERITSPTFTLANQYRGRLLLHHLDVYRLDSVAETLDLDLPDLLESGVTAIEWGDKIGEVLPAEHLLVTLRYPDLDAGTHIDGGSTEAGCSPEGAGVQAGREPDGGSLGDQSDEFTGLDDRIIEFTAVGDSWCRRLAMLAARLERERSG